MMKNVFVEGIQGMGKTTLLHCILTAVPELHACREGEYSPVDLAWCAWMSPGDYEAMLRRHEPLREELLQNTVQERGNFVVPYTKIRTAELHKEFEQYEIYNGKKTLREFKELVFARYQNFSETGYLFECSFFQNIVEELMLFQLLSDDEIVAFYRELFAIIRKDHFLLLYLYGEDLEENLRMIKKERCDPFGVEEWYQMMLAYLQASPYGQQHGSRGFEDLLGHFRHRQGLELRIIRDVLGDKAVLLPAKKWNMDEILPLLR